MPTTITPAIKMRALLEQQGMMDDLNNKQQAVVMMVIDPEFRRSIKCGACGDDANLRLTRSELDSLAAFPDRALDEATARFRAGLAVGGLSGEGDQIAVLGVFIAGMVVGYVAYGFASSW